MRAAARHSVVARNSKMADTKGGLFAKTVQKHAGRAKEKVSAAVRVHEGLIMMGQRAVRGCDGGGVSRRGACVCALRFRFRGRSS